jgi:4-amino-4-deoxy-L-arabinose transferase-like glycosyltransferase
VNTSRSSYIPIIALILIYCLLGIFLFSFENYPVDDDWSYIKAAEIFHHTGEMKFTPWTAMSLVFQIWWGTCFTKLFGFSVAVLRLSTLVISLLGLICFYRLLQEVIGNWQTSFLLMLLVLFNPFSLPLNFTFFTDHFFISLLFGATYFYYKACKENKDSYLLLASLVSACAVLVRQNGILIPVAVVLCLIARERSFNRAARKGFLTLILPLTTLIAYTYWFNAVHGPTAEYIRQSQDLLANITKPHVLIYKVVFRSFLFLEFMGYCLIPLSLSLLPGFRELVNRKIYFLIFLFCLSGTLFYLLFDHIGLYSTTDLWLNGFCYAFVSEYGYRDFLNIIFFFQRVIDFLSVLSIMHLVYLVIKHRKSLRPLLTRTSPSLVVMLIGIFQLLFLFITLYKFNRYYLVIVPFCMFLILQLQQQIVIRKKVFVPLLLAYAVFSVAVTQDVMSWNQCKWRVSQQMLDKGISTRKLSAGFAWDAWHNYQFTLDHPYAIATLKGGIPWWIEDILPGIDPEYIISNSPVPTGFENLYYFHNDRYRVVSTAAYYSLFYGRNMKIFTLQREQSTDPRTEGTVSFDFVKNLPGVQTRGVTAPGSFTQMAADIGGDQRKAWLQASASSALFRLQLPYGRCRLKAAIGTPPASWDKPGDGALCKILVDDILVENIFTEIASIRVSELREFFRPRTFFFKEPRTYFNQYIDPAHDRDARSWQDISVDFSAYAGKVVDITFDVSGGPFNDCRNDEVLWANPVIESY